jgi:hypothetical protein
LIIGKQLRISKNIAAVAGVQLAPVVMPSKAVLTIESELRFATGIEFGK